MKTGDAVWVVSGPAMPVGARVLGDAGDGKFWLDVCIFGQHLPQMYRVGETAALTAELCPQLGLCPDCLGWGDLSAVTHHLDELARGIDEIERLCPNCGGTGRPALRVSLRRGPGSVSAEIRPVPHKFVPPLPDRDPEMMALFEIPDGTCLACGMPDNGTGPHGEPLHLVQA